MNNIREMIRDVLYVSKITNTRNKKILILISVLLSQVAAFTDVALIVIFSALIGNQFTNIDFVNSFLEVILQNKYLLFPIVFLRYLFNYIHIIILKKIELSVWRNLRQYFLREIFDRRNYSTGDAYFYINTLSMHISYFYSNFANFLNALLQIFAYTFYLVVSDTKTLGVFGLGLLILYYPLKVLLAKSKNSLDKAYSKDYESNKEIERVVDNLLLVKILKKEESELSRFTKILNDHTKHSLDNHKFGSINSFLPTLFTLTVLSYFLAFTPFSTKISLDFIGVTLRLFQSLGIITKSITNINNSHVHIEKFYQLETNKSTINYSNFEIHSENNIKVENLSFKYVNSDEFIFENINLKFKKNKHTIITGPNGSGKSTVLGLISGIYFSNEGKVFSFSNKFGYIGATPLIFDGTLYENLTYGNSGKINKVEVINYLKLLDTFKEESGYELERRVNNKELSSGQMQKISFVRALISDVDILLLDESTSNLDQESKNKIFDLLSSRDITIINSTHIPESFINVDHRYNIDIIDEKRVFNLLY